MKKLFLLLLFFPLILFSQNEGNIWYFGENAGLDFNSGSPIPLTDGMINTLEGCASICDNNGNLLFYTDGMTLYNKDHTIMPNGSGILGHSSSTQSAIIVKKPSSSTIYYLFTVDGITGNLGGLNYSEIDITLDNGLGDVTLNKNINLIPFTCEKVTAVMHQNGSDFWIVSPELNTNIIYSFLLTSTGLNLLPTQTNAFSPVDGVGYLKGSPDATRIVMVNSNMLNFEIYSFNSSTGLLTFQLQVPNLINGPYGVEFSPNSNIIYISNWNGAEVWQYNLMAGSNIDIINSALSLGAHGVTGGALQLAPNNKIYQALGSNWGPGVTNLPVINNPDVIGVGCDFNINGADLGGRLSIYGLPTFFSSIFVSTLDVNNICYGDSSYFAGTNSSVDSISWNFGDINSGLNNTSSDPITFHIFSDTGTFDVILYSYVNGIIDTSINSIYINPLPNVNLGIDTSICDGEILLLAASIQNATYQWMDNSINSNYEVTTEGNYWVQITDTNGCSNIDTIYIIINSLPEVNLGEDSVLCEGDTLFLDATQKNATYLWQDNLTSSNYNAIITNNYSVIVTDSNGCFNSDTINVTFNPLPNSDFTFNPQPTDLNNPEITFINTSSNDTSLIWDLGDGTIIEDEIYFHHIYQSAGQYTVSLIIINRYNCVDTIDYKVIIDPGKFHLFIPNSFTPNNDGHNELFVIKGRYIIEFSLKIFNQWGKQLFASSDIYKYWDGRYKGKISPQDKYTYLITVLDINGDTHEFTGVIHLIQ